MSLIDPSPTALQFHLWVFKSSAEVLLVLQTKIHLALTSSHHYYYCSSVITQLKVFLMGGFAKFFAHAI